MDKFYNTELNTIESNLKIIEKFINSVNKHYTDEHTNLKNYYKYEKPLLQPEFERIHNNFKDYLNIITKIKNKLEGITNIIQDTTYKIQNIETKIKEINIITRKSFFNTGNSLQVLTASAVEQHYPNITEGPENEALKHANKKRRTTGGTKIQRKTTVSTRKYKSKK